MSDVAYKSGKYNDFNGEIEYGGTKCRVIKAKFELLKKAKRFKNQTDIFIVFNSGIVMDGDMQGVDIEECDFRGTSILESVFRGGKFSGLVFHKSHWINGTWENGEWIGSFDKFGRLCLFPPSDWNKSSETINEANETGHYNNFSGEINWQGSRFTVKNADFELSDKYDVFINFIGGTIVDGKISRVNVEYCIFEGGIFEVGLWNNGTWKGGTWVSGVWLDGIWLGGYDDNSIWHDKGDSPDKWDL